jgi:GalNAc-alpha-(1->4)-GalNAc-alpha-(1->3)-diNAcBac-PP-undecaprenol alpha-1,4-N-acetyl-D-galactosaminyltransferase
MKIVFVIASVAIEGGGASKMLVWVANKFRENNDDVYIYTHKPMHGPLFPLNDNIKLISSVNEDKNIFYPINNIRKLINEISPNIIISFMSDSNLYCMLAGFKLKVPIVICERNDPSMRTFWKNRIADRLSFMADAAVFQLQQARDYYKWFKKPVAIIPNPILPSDIYVKNKITERKDEICNVARMVIFQKRQDILINAFAIVSKKYPLMKLVLFGEGIDMDKLKLLVSNLGLNDKVIFKGLVKKPITQIVESKIFVLSSDFEGISNSLTEAMSAGLTVISTDTSPGGARLLIDDDVNGFIVPRSDVNALADKIIYCLDNPEVSDYVANNAKNIVADFSELKVFQMWRNFVFNIVNK